MDLNFPEASPRTCATAPFVLQAPTVPGWAEALVVASGHSGRDYSTEFLAGVRLDPAGLRRSEDSFVDELFAAAPALGAPLLAATFPRAWCDANREAWELDPAMFDDKLPDWANTTSARVGAGLGTIARIVASGEAIYSRKLRFAEAEHRVRSCWEPYHAALSTLLADARRRTGRCLLVDCHSMPTGAVPATSHARPRGPDIVLGDAHGTSCDPRVTRVAEMTLLDLGYSVRRNDPYAGGYVTRHYGDPRNGVHTLQIEVARGLYMDEARFERTARFTRVQQDMARLLAAMAEVARNLG
jgi:N-formylglutamate amidohydrolase